MQALIEALNCPWLTRIWMEGNLRWLVHVCAGLMATGLLAIFTLFAPSLILASLSLLALLGTLFIYRCTGLVQGLLLTPLYQIPGYEKVIALTFDDGPDAEQTEKILTVLAEQGVSASFFFTGSRIDRYPELARKAATGGHDIGCHSYSHRNLRLAGPTAIREEIRRFEESLQSAGLHNQRLFRPPHGAKSPLLEAALKRHDYRLVHWNLSAKDWKAEPVETMLQRLLKHTQPGSIVLLHDTANAAALLPHYIAALKEKGYRFRKISEFA